MQYAPQFSSVTNQSQAPYAFYVANPRKLVQGWLRDSSASHHVATDMQNLAIHYDYDGTNDVSVGILWQHLSHYICNPKVISFEQSYLLYNIVTWYKKLAFLGIKVCSSRVFSFFQSKIG